jgi:hypothetical protein
MAMEFSGGQYFEHVGYGGGRSAVDFIGLDKFSGLQIDITTKGWKPLQTKYNKYNPWIIVPGYERPANFRSIFK